MRMAAALGLATDLIEPCGFILDDTRLRRAVMDYYELLNLTRHASWAAFMRDRPPSRVVLLSTAAATPYTDFSFRADDILMVGRESAGVPQEVHDAADARVLVPMKPPARSLNVAVAAAMVVGEALRQTRTGSFAR